MHRAAFRSQALVSKSTYFLGGACSFTSRRVRSVCAVESGVGEELSFSNVRPTDRLAVRKTNKVRLDSLCHELFPQHSKKALQSWILQGKVIVDSKVVSKAGHQVYPSSKILVNAEEQKYACRAGHKLEKALLHFNIDLNGKVALDSGQSTGGFSDCLLQNGITQVFGVDVGYGQLADKVRRDPRVVVIERCNLRYLKPEQLPCKVDIVCLDLSFISVLKVLPAVMGVLRPDPGAEIVILIKPQFEAGRAQVGTGGLVKDPKVHEEVISRVTAGVEAWGFRNVGCCESPIKGEKSGNTEFLAYFVRDASMPVDPMLLAMRLPVPDNANENAKGLQ